MARTRTFIAVDPGEAIRQQALALQKQLTRGTDRVKWTEADNLHLTLQFLGEVERKETLAICQLVQRCAKSFPSFNLEVTGLGAFPTPRRPKIIWLGIGDGRDELIALHDRIEAPLAERGGYRREDRGYTPHLTLGRIASEEREDGWTEALAEHAGWSAGATLIDEVLVMSSELHRSGPVYSILGRAKLTGKRSREVPIVP